MTKSRRIATAFLIVSLLLTSCGTAEEATPDTMEVQNKINAAVAQTLSALTTQIAEVQQTKEAQPTETQQPTATLESTATQPPAQTGNSGSNVSIPQTAAPGSCTDYAAYVSDVTIPDGTMVPPGTSFVKTWAIRNAGSCTWTPNYKMVWVGADPMGSEHSVQMTTQNVAPGQTAYVSVTLTAPTELKKHVFSQWKMMNSNGQVFGAMGNDGVERYLYSEIYVGNTYNFVTNLCSATWSTSAGILPCPGNKNDPRGFVLLNSAPAIEGGVKENEPAIVMHPPDEADSFIVGQYPPIVVPEGSNLVLHFGCLEGYTKCNVRFRIAYSIEGGAEQELLNRVHGFGEWEYVSINLTQNNRFAMMNKAVSFLFYFYPMEGSSDNYAFLFSPIMTP
ncbi:MAG: hypothetical protein GYA15_09420 [Leptolinea sp.]|nr:hypothetical protein [Leptolinea sp.]